MTGRIFLTFIICLSKLCDDDKIKLKDKMEYFLYASIKVVVAIGYMLVGALWTSILVFSYRFFIDRDIEFVIGIVVLIIAIIEEVLVIKEFKKN